MFGDNWGKNVFGHFEW